MGTGDAIRRGKATCRPHGRSTDKAHPRGRGVVGEQRERVTGIRKKSVTAPGFLVTTRRRKSCIMCDGQPDRVRSDGLPEDPGHADLAPIRNSRRDSSRARMRLYSLALVLLLLHMEAVGTLYAADPLSSLLQSQNGTNKSTVIATDVPIELHADSLKADKEGNFTARGNVTASRGNTHISADTARFDAKTKEMTALGRVIMRVGSDVLEADKFTLKFTDATGVIYNGKLFLTRHNIYLEGKKLEKTGESSYRIEDGSFTTCNGTSPDWRITGKDLDVTLEGYGRLKHGFFYIKNVPVFYLPWMIYPAKRKRQSGFLMPTIANSSVRGVDVRFPFFLDISPSVDATIVPRICTKRAAQTSLELRYIPTESLAGRFYGEYTYDWKYGPESNPKSHRFYITWRHDQDLGADIKFKANANWISDRNYFQFWGGRLDKRFRVRYLESNAILFRQSNNFLFQAEARHFDNLDLPDNALTVQNLPTVSGTLFNRKIPYTPFHLSTNLVYDHFHAPVMNNQWLGNRLQVDSRLSIPVALGRYLKIEPSMNYFAKAYAADYYVHDKSISSVNAIRTDLYQVNADVFTDLESVYDGRFMGFQRIRHTVRPRFAWTYRPFSSPQTYPYFDETDRLDRISLLTAEMRQTLTGRLGPGEYLDFATLSVSQGYDLDGRETPDDQRHPGSYDKQFWTTTQAELILKPHSLVDLTARAEYDPVFNRTQRYGVDVRLMDHRGDQLRVLHQFTQDDKREDLNRQTNINLLVKVTSALDCFLENQYSHQYDFSYFTSFGLEYHPQCWSVLLRYSEVREKDPVSRKIKDADQTVFLTLSLYGLGQVYQMTRDWSDLFGHSPEAADSKTRKAQ